MVYPVLSDSVMKPFLAVQRQTTLLWEVPYKRANWGRYFLKQLLVANSNTTFLELKPLGYS